MADSSGAAEPSLPTLYTRVEGYRGYFGTTRFFVFSEIMGAGNMVWDLFFDKLCYLLICNV